MKIVTNRVKFVSKPDSTHYNSGLDSFESDYFPVFRVDQPNSFDTSNLDPQI